MVLPRFVAASLSLLLVLCGGTAYGNMAAVQRFPGRIDGPVSEAHTSLEVEREQLNIRCDEGPPARCTFRATYAVYNPTAEAQSVVAAFYGLRAESVEVRIAGTPTHRPLTPAERVALDRAVLEAQAPGVPVDVAQRSWETLVQRSGFDLSVAPGGRTEVVATGVLLLSARSIPSNYAVSAIRARHPGLHRSTPRQVFDVDYMLGPIRTWGRVGPIDVTVDLPSSWRLEGATVSPELDPMPPHRGRPVTFTSERSGERTRGTARTGTDAGMVLSLQFTREEGLVHHGGPFVGLGGTVGPNGGFNTRIGYEFAAPAQVVYSVSADTDWSTRVVLAPTVELASPWVVLLPSFAAGLGLPVQFAPTIEVGARVQGAMHLGPVGFVTSVDLYPRLLSNDAPGGVRVSLFGQLSI